MVDTSLPQPTLHTLSWSSMHDGKHHKGKHTHAHHHGDPDVVSFHSHSHTGPGAHHSAEQVSCDGLCDEGTLITVPSCLHHEVQCIERCDICEQWPDDASAAAHLAPRVSSQIRFCGNEPGCYHFVVEAQRHKREAASPYKDFEAAGAGHSHFHVHHSWVMTGEHRNITHVPGTPHDHPHEDHHHDTA